MRPTQLFSSALLCTSLASAFSWPDAALDVVEFVRPYERRSPQVQTLGDTNAATPNPTENLSTATSATKATTTNGKSSASNAKSSGSSASETSDGSAATTSGGSAAESSGQTSSGKSSGSGKSTGTATTKHTSSSSVDPRLPAGGVSMITPNPLSSTEYYKIGNYITFAWNYTSLSNTPSAIDILASCSANQATYTLALNQSITGPTGAITWDTNEYQKTATVQLLTETYTLIIYDAASSISATPAAGDLGVYNQFTFGMYTPQPYVGLQDYVCATCNGAPTLMDGTTMAFMAGMATISVISFTSFLGGAGLLF